MHSSDWLAAQASASPQSQALAADGTTLTYFEFHLRVNELCARLNHAGIQPGDVLATVLQNTLDHACIAHACVRLNLVFAPLNTRLTGSELAWQLDRIRANLVIVDSEERLQPLRAPDRLCLTCAVLNGPDHAQPTQTVGVIARAPAALRSDDRWQYNQPLAIMFTSGTTSKPKAAMISHENVFFNAVCSAARLGTLPNDRWLMCLPLFHIGGLVMLFRACLQESCVQLVTKFDVTAVNHALDYDGITLISLVPTMLHQLLQARAAPPPDLRAILLGGAAASDQLVSGARSLGYPIAITYGLTEATSQVATSHVNTSQVNTPEITSGIGSALSVGKPLLFTAVRILTEGGTAAAPGEIGEICVRGPSVMMGYFDEPTNPISDGELHTGDMGYLGTAGDLYVVQRRTDLIVSGGENVYPAEVEAILRQHPQVSDVCVVGIPDPMWGQRVAAMVTVRSPATVAEIDAYCRERLAGFKVPRTITMVDALPMTESGKIARSVVQATIAASQHIREHENSVK